MINKFINLGQVSLKGIPFVEQVARSAFHKTSLYQKRLKVIKEQQIAVKQKNNHYLSRYLNDDLTVRYGPFQGMKYISKSYTSTLLPKVVGSYEAPIHSWIETIPHNNYCRIIDIGCAEGYYAVGFAMRGFASEVIAIDVNPQALSSARELATKNKLKTKLDFVNIYLTPYILNNWIEQNTLIFCDIDGAEAELLCPTKAHKLNLSDMIIETHDCFRPGITELLIERFSNTHQIEIIVDHQRIAKNYPLLAEMDNSSYLFAENRPGTQNWMRLIALETEHL